MFERDHDIVERVVRHLRRTPGIDSAFDARVMSAVAAASAGTSSQGSRTRRAAPWLALAAALTALLVARPWRSGGQSGSRDALQFVLVAPRAASVALVGDFNDWDPARTPMRAVPSPASGVWSTVVSLPPGRYRYAFLVDGAQWRADPGAPAALGDEFGAPSSVVTVGGS